MDYSKWLLAVRERMNSRIGRRLFAVFGILWIGTIVTVLLLQQDVPILWKFAWALYGGFGLFDMAATLMGKDEVWSKGLRRAQLIAFMVSSFLFLIGFIQEE